MQAALEIFEFANSQLLEFRYYDQLLDVELARHLRPVAEAATPSVSDPWGYVAATTHLHALFVDVNELTDRTKTP